MMRLVALLSLVATSALADNQKLAAEPCVHRNQHVGWRMITPPILDEKAIFYCTGDDCWSYDRETRKITSALSRPTVPATAPDPDGILTDGHGNTRATADDSHIEVCSRASACKSIKYKVAAAAARVYPLVNATFTLAAVLYVEPGDNDVIKHLVAFDVASGKALGQLAGESIEVLDHGFLVDSKTLYDAAFKKVGTLAAPDEVWVALGSTDRIALRDYQQSQIVIQDTRTAKALARIPTGFLNKQKAFINLVLSADARTLYAIGWDFSEGEVIAIDVAAAKVTSRASPPVCAAGTYRR